MCQTEVFRLCHFCKLCQDYSLQIKVLKEGKESSALYLVFTANHEVFNSPNLLDPEVDLLVGWVLEDGVHVDLVQLFHITQHPVSQRIFLNVRPGSLMEYSCNLSFRGLPYGFNT